ncbi:hypothetical protein ABZX40_26660 [Streptomyces sp. NPDC004610]|uniref:hypothetical protein n=1 Tax=unclassified Streptomyces TaxID=2593676 RepID=UPI0033B96B40
MPNDGGGLVLDLCSELIDGYARRQGPMPVVVLHAAEEDPLGRHDDRVKEIVDLVHLAQKPRWLLCRSVDPPPGTGALPVRPPGDAPDTGDGGYAAATALVKEVAGGLWENSGRSQYRPYRLPCSQLLAALDQALDDVAARGEGTPDPRAVVARLSELRRPAGARRWSGGFRQTLGPVLSPATALGSAAVACVGVLAARLGSWYLVGAMLVTLVLWAAGGRVRHWAAPARLGPGCRWFATTTFPVSPSTEAPVWSLWRPRLSRATLEERAVEVVRQLLTAARPVDAAGETTGQTAEREVARQFCLQLRTLALLEDLRESHRPAWDLRHRKRTVPPLLLIPRATRANGALPLLRAISDVRSRRSEQDPLLVVAGIAHADLAGLSERTLLPLPAPGARGRDVGELYEAWVERSLRTGQSPSMNAALPWILPVALSGELLRPHDGYASAESHRRKTFRVPRSAWLLWSRWTLLAVCALATLGAAAHYQYLTGKYCGGREVVWNHDLEQIDDECVGVASSTPLPVGDGPVLGVGRDQRRIGLDWLQKKITEANRNLDPDKEHITLVFAGALTTRAQESGEAVDVLRQLAGVYLAQHHINSTQESNSALQVRLLIANGGQGMRHQEAMAAKIVGLARRDRSVVGVVGMGIHTPGSAPAVREFQKAGLAVIGTTNSATALAERFGNYVGMAATDREQASALVHLLGAARGRSAVVLAPAGSGGSGDSYGADQSRYAREELGRAGFTPHPGIDYPVRGTSPKLVDAVKTVCDQRADIVYLAGRASHLKPLMQGLAQDPGCLGHTITVLSGDDMTKKRFADDSFDFPAGARLLYAALTYEETLKHSDLYGFAQRAFGSARLPTHQDPLFTDGFLALSYDAATALHRAADKAQVPENGGAPAVLAALRSVDFRGAATGHITFRHSDATDPNLRGHGIGLYRITQPTEGARFDITLVCGRPAGDTRRQEEWGC